jgi:hypothetical protein
MMIKVSNEFLDFDDLIEVEKQIKLFEDISTTDGDFSYSFELQKTLNNTKLLGNPFPDNINKPVYQKIPAKLLSDSGAETYDGYLRVQRVTEVYECSFFAGNNNWFTEITGLLTDLDLSRYDIEQTEDNVVNSWSQTEGIVFPLLDNGGLITRSYPEVKIEDFVGAFYVKTIFNKIFAEAGIKIQGELLEDWRFQNMVSLSNSKDQEGINAATSFVEKNVLQVLPHNSEQKVIWDNDSTLPYFDGASDNFDIVNDQYIPKIKSIVKVESSLAYFGTGFFGLLLMFVKVNGVTVRTVGIGAPSGTEVTISVNATVSLNANDVLEIYAIQANSDGDAGDLRRGTLKITPTFIYKTFGRTAVPNWTKQQFVSNILRMFNVLASYREGDATLTLNLFEKIKGKDPIDLSEYISSTEVDYNEFISDYGKRSLFSYKQVDYDELKDYNKGKYFKYGQGVIEINNDFLNPDEAILESDFANPIAYQNSVFDMSMEKTNLIELEEGESVTFGGVGNDGLGNASFDLSNQIFIVGDLVRIKESSNPIYNGDWVVTSTPFSGGDITLNGVPFNTTATGTAVKLNYKYSSSEDVFIFINVPNYAASKFSGTQIVLNSESYYPLGISNIALAYFDLINLGRQVNTDFIYSLSFGGIDDPLHYQTTMIDSYFRLFSRMLNDPVKLISTATLPYDVYNRIDFLSPVTIKTLETSNLYYLNRITGFKESYYDSTLELIKLA